MYCRLKTEPGHVLLLSGSAQLFNALTKENLIDVYRFMVHPVVLRKGERLFADGNLNPWTEAKVDTKNPDRGPLLIISGGKDHTVPPAIANASYKQQQNNEGVTEIVEIPDRGHALVIDNGWRDVADKALAFVKRFVPAAKKS